MNELLQKLIKEVGLTPEQAQKSVDSVKDFIKSKIPPAFSGAIDNFLNSEALHNAKEHAGEAADKAKAFMHDAAEKADDVADVVKEKLSHLGAEAKEELAEAKEELAEAKEKAAEIADDVKEKLAEAKDKAEDMAKDALDKLKGLFGGNKSNEPTNEGQA